MTEKIKEASEKTLVERIDAIRIRLHSKYPDTCEDIDKMLYDLQVDAYALSLSSPVEKQEDLQSQYDKLKDVFMNLLDKYSPNNKICRNAWLITAGLKENK